MSKEQEAVQKILQEIMGPDHLVTKFVIVLESYSSEEDQHMLRKMTSDGATYWEAFGLMEAAKADMVVDWTETVREAYIDGSA